MSTSLPLQLQLSHLARIIAIQNPSSAAEINTVIQQAPTSGLDPLFTIIARGERFLPSRFKDSLDTLISGLPLELQLAHFARIIAAQDPSPSSEAEMNEAIEKARTSGPEPLFAAIAGRSNYLPNDLKVKVEEILARRNLHPLSPPIDWSRVASPSMVGPKRFLQSANFDGYSCLQIQLLPPITDLRKTTEFLEMLLFVSIFEQGTLDFLVKKEERILSLISPDNLPPHTPVENFNDLIDKFDLIRITEKDRLSISDLSPANLERITLNWESFTERELHTALHAIQIVKQRWESTTEKIRRLEEELNIHRQTNSLNQELLWDLQNRIQFLLEELRVTQQLVFAIAQTPEKLFYSQNALLERYRQNQAKIIAVEIVQKIKRMIGLEVKLSETKRLLASFDEANKGREPSTHSKKTIEQIKKIISEITTRLEKTNADEILIDLLKNIRENIHPSNQRSILIATYEMIQKMDVRAMSTESDDNFLSFFELYDPLGKKFNFTTVSNDQNRFAEALQQIFFPVKAYHESKGIVRYDIRGIQQTEIDRYLKINQLRKWLIQKVETALQLENTAHYATLLREQTKPQTELKNGENDLNFKRAVWLEETTRKDLDSFGVEQVRSEFLEKVATMDASERRLLLNMLVTQTHVWLTERSAETAQFPNRSRPQETIFTKRIEDGIPSVSVAQVREAFRTVLKDLDF